MTRSNLYITLSSGSNIVAVADSSSAPEQGYIVEQLILPLLSCNDADKERALLAEHCHLNELRSNATYRYHIDLQTKTLHFSTKSITIKRAPSAKAKTISAGTKNI